MERWNSLPQILRYIVVGIGIFALGAAFSFGFSYRPLYGSLTFKVDSLEARLDERNRELRELKDELTRLRNDDSTRIEPETLSQIESELAKTKVALREAEKKAKHAEGKRADANANADRWRKRFESLRDQQQAIAARAEPAPAAPPAAAQSPMQPDSATPPIPPPLPSSELEPMNDDLTLDPTEFRASDSSESDAFARP